MRAEFPRGRRGGATPPNESENLSVAAMHTTVPLSNFMVRLFAEELPMLDSQSRLMIYEELKAYDGPEITSQEELPARIRELMDL